jgi:hypothetical protein
VPHPSSQQGASEPLAAIELKARQPVPPHRWARDQGRAKLPLARNEVSQIGQTQRLVSVELDLAHVGHTPSGTPRPSCGSRSIFT